MSEPKKRSRRGARLARMAERNAPLAAADRPVNPGMSGGNFSPLAAEDVGKVNEAVMDILANTGLSQAIPSCIEAVKKGGGTYKDGRLFFPRSLVEDTIANCARGFQLHGQTPEHDIDISGSKLYFGTAGAAVHIVDVEGREYRDSTLEDLYNIARIVDRMDHIHYFQRSVVARDMEDPADLDLNTLYACISGTTKHVGSSWVLPEHVDQSLKLLHQVAGSEAAWRTRPFVSMSCCFVVPPLRFAEDACACLESAVYGGMPVLLLSAGQAGATSPAAIAGSVVQSVSEVLAGLVYVNMLRPKHPAICGTWPFVSDLRTGAMSGGSGEQAILMAACGQMMGSYYDLPTGIAAGMADAKLPDAQSGYEKGYTVTLAAHSGANMIYESAGMHASLLGACLESYVIDNDMLGAINRTVRGIDVNDETLSIDTMRDVCIDGPLHYLGHQQTMDLMQKEYLYPEIGDRNSPKEWYERKRPDLLKEAAKKVDAILTGHFPSHIESDLDAKLRSEFNIKLPRELMTKG
ncbi:methyltransferase [Chromatiales bacterium (ex Bugula neritina AB1)]|nr:methyltransferase [Chromatiales bacterium (ex Bugula neritina AB1)]